MKLLSKKSRKEHYNLSKEVYKDNPVIGVLFKYGSVECLVTQIPENNRVRFTFRGSAGALDWVTNARWFSKKLGSMTIETGLHRLDFGGAITFGTTRPFVGKKKIKTQAVLQRHVRKCIHKILKSGIVPNQSVIELSGHSKGGKEAAIATALMFGYQSTVGILHCVNKKDFVTSTPSKRWHFGLGEIDERSIETSGIDHALEDYLPWVS